MSLMAEHQGTDPSVQVRPVTSFRDQLLLVAGHWEEQPTLKLPYSRHRAGEVAAWIRRLVRSEADADPTESRSVILGLRRAVAKLGSQVAKTERELRDIALDRDRWRRRATEAEALVRSAGL